jgi:asparagine synthase (glutamine-hydrolysing)
MCGICGFTGEGDPATLRRMSECLVHRGPDDDGFYHDSRVHLGMRRLAIVDVEMGKQPQFNEDRSLVVVQNGEIYNHQPLRQELERLGHHFRTHHSDTELIPHLYEEYGKNWPNRVNGMFGTALWDVREQKLLLYRDRIGKKPLYYAVKNGQLVFASEIKAILAHPRISGDLDYGALYRYFALKNISAPHTAFAAIRQLLPGHFLVWQGGEIKTCGSYWRPNFGAVLEDITEEEAARHLLELLQDAVKIRMQCDVPYGAYLSGGVDSTAVVALMCQNQAQPVKTFCLGYEDKAEGQFVGKSQDLYFARTMSEQLGTEHYEYIINADQFAEQMPAVMAAFDEPFSGTVSTFFLSTLIKQHVKVALSGDGADELFGSYLSHRLAFPMERYLRLAAGGKTSWQGLTGEERRSLSPFDTPEQFAFLQRLASPRLAGWRRRLGVFQEDEIRQLLTPDFLQRAGNPGLPDRYQELEAGLTARDILNKNLEMDQLELLPNQCLPFVDRLSMAHAIEVRCPFLDYRIIEFASQLPGKYKINQGIIKYIHKKAVENLLPKDLLERPKEGFVQPIYSWMHASLKNWVESCLDSLPPEIFNGEYLQDLKNAFKSDTPGMDAKIWNLVCFQIWWHKVLRDGHSF